MKSRTVKVGHGGPNLDFSKEFARAINEFRGENFKAMQEALFETAVEGTKILANATPVGTGQFKSGWNVEGKYANTKYIYNSRLADNRIPLSNLFEYSRRHEAFIFKTFNQNQGELFRLFVKKMKQKL